MNHSVIRHCRAAATSFVLAAAALAAAADRLPDAGIRLAGTNAVVSALEALRGMTGHIAQTRDIPYPDRFARLLKEKAGLTLADRPFFFLSWLPEEMTGAATPEAALAFMEDEDGEFVPGQLLILPVEEDGSGDFPGLASDAANDAAFHRGRWFYLAERPEAKAFAERCGADPFPVLAACQAFYDTDPPARGVARAFLREPARFRPLRDGMLAKRKEFHANLARLRERDAAGEDVGDELRWAEHMETHAKAEEAIGDLLFSLLDASKFAYVDLDCDATRGLRVIRVLEGIPPSEPLDERIRLRRFLEDNIPFLAFPDPEEAAWQEARRVWHNRFVDAADQLTDIWVLPPDAVGTIAYYTLLFFAESATPAAAKPSAQPDADGDGLPDSVERERFNTNPDNPDTDADGIRDGDEATKYHTDPCNPDTDADGLRDGDEMYKHRTDPLNPDTDGDGLADGAEVLKHKTNPLNPDTDGDGVKDGAEIDAGTDPLRHAEGAEKKPHAEFAEGAEGLEGRAPSRPEEGSGEAEPSPSVAPPPAP